MAPAPRMLPSCTPGTRWNTPPPTHPCPTSTPPPFPWLPQLGQAEHLRQQLPAANERIRELERQLAAARAQRAEVETALQRERAQGAGKQTAAELHEVVATLQREVAALRAAADKHRGLPAELEAGEPRGPGWGGLSRGCGTRGGVVARAMLCSPTARSDCKSTAWAVKAKTWCQLVLARVP